VEEPNPAMAPMISDTKATMKNNRSSKMIQSVTELCYDYKI
jgi:hypothetical protein